MRSFVIYFLLGAFNAAAQSNEGFRCLANNPTELERHIASHPGALEHALQMQAELNERVSGIQRGGGDPLIIPVVFHIVHNNGPENIADEQLYDAIRILNEDFSAQNPDRVNVRPEFADLVDEVGIEFRLARRDPEGNCTNGITRTVSDRTYDGDFEMTQLIQWPRDRYMNVWVSAGANGAAGYTYYPIWLDGWPEADGIVILHNYTGSIGTSAPYTSRVLSHEVGHWLNLKHCWGDSNEPGLPENCDFDDDVADTPLTIGWTFCSPSGASCGSTIDNVQNYMEYSYCCKMFTHGQGDRMVAALTSPIAQRENLSQPGNLALTGVLEEPQLCTAEFVADRREVCAGSPVSFSDHSYFGVTQRFWSFPGGNPAISFAQDPTVTYAAPGTYPVTLSVGDGTNTIQTTLEDYVTVRPNPGASAPIIEGFEAASGVPNGTWSVYNPDQDNTFQLTSEAAFSGSQCVRFPNTAEADGRVDELISNTFDMSAASAINITFRYAYARRFPDNDDVLKVYVSGNCGDTWILRKLMRATTSLLTAGVVSGDFTPYAPDEWGYAVMTNIAPSLHTPNFRVKFEFESDGGNNLFIDDINILDSPVGLPEQNRAGTSLSVWPDPVDHSSRLQLRIEATIRVELNLVDPLGRSIRTLANGTLQAGNHSFELPIDDLPAGAYLIRLRSAGQQRITRFIVP